jgi:hypothetical protein
MRAIPTSPLADPSNVVNLSAYRRQKRLRSSRSPKSQKPNTLQRPESPQLDFWLDANYRERMKVNAIVFVFLMFLITTGIWLLDGLADGFGPERLTRQHSQIGEVGVTTTLHSASGAHALF